MQQNYSTNELKSETLKVYPGLAAQALKTDHTAAYGIWTLARSLDAAGQGAVSDLELRSLAAAAADWDDRKYRRARHEAIGLGLMSLAGDGDTLYLISLENAAYRLGARRIGRTPIGVNVRTLSQVKSWRAALRDSFLAGQKPNPISQKTIEAMTGLTPRTQYGYSKLNPRAVVVIHNYARLQNHFDPAQLAGVKEFIPGAYAKDGGLWATLPNTYSISELAYPRLRPGRSRRAQSNLNTLVNNAAGQGSIVRPVRRYHETRQSAFKTLKRAGRGNVKLPDQLYVLGQVKTADNGRPLFALWSAYPD